VTLPPVDGKANAGVIRTSLGVLRKAKSRIVILKGASGRQKFVEITWTLNAQTNSRALRSRRLEEFSSLSVSNGTAGNSSSTGSTPKRLRSFQEMTPLSGTLREKLSGIASSTRWSWVEEQKSRADGTTKFLFQLADAEEIESVLIPRGTAFRGREATGEEEQKRLTLCVSTQVGCPLDCASVRPQRWDFTATSRRGDCRPGTPGEEAFGDAHHESRLYGLWASPS